MTVFIIIFIVLFIVAVTGWHLLRHFFVRLRFIFKLTNFKEANELRAILEENFDYYNQLSYQGKERFVKRCFYFMKTKTFHGMEGLKVTDEMIATISATAVQLTFGFHKSTYDFYHTIKIFPETFYSRIFDRHLKGGASVGGVMYFSWKDFKEGYADPSDKYNLGLHEMAHALRMELFYGSNFDKRFANYTDEWVEIAMVEFERMNKGNTSFLRDYAATNIEEFFAVCVEHFFEVPDEFKLNLPDIYNHLCYLLNQDPTNSGNDFRLKPDFASIINFDKKLIPIPKKYKTNYKYSSWHWSFNFIIFGLFIGLFAALSFAPVIIIQTSEVVLVFIVCLIIVLRFRKYFYNKGIFLIRHLAMFAICGVALNVLPMAMFLNMSFDSEKEEQTIYRIKNYRYYIISENELEIVYELENNALRSKQNMRTFKFNRSKMMTVEADFLVINTTTGLFGWKNIESRSRLHYPEN